MFWIEIDDLTGWLVKVQNEMLHFPQFAVVKEHLYNDIWRTYPSSKNEKEAIENVEKLNNNREFDYSEYNVVYHYPRESFIPIRQVIVKSNKTAAPESYTDISDVDQSNFKNLNFWHWEEKDLPFSLDKYPGEVTHEYKNKPKVHQELDDYPNQAYDGVQASLEKLSWNELPNAESIEQYDVNPLTEINLYPSRRKERQDPVKYKLDLGDPEMISEKGLHEITDRSETERDLIPYAKLSWQLKDSDALASIKEGEIWKGVLLKSGFEFYILPIENLKISFDKTSYPYITFYGFDGLSIDDLEQEFQNRSPHYITVGGKSFKDIGTPETTGTRWERIGDYRDVFSFLKLSWQENNISKNVDRVFEELNLPVELQKQFYKDVFFGSNLVGILNKGTYSTIKKLVEKWKVINKISSQNQDFIFIYVKPNKDFPLKIKEAHTTVVYLNNSIKEEDRENIIKDISNLLKDYKKPKLFFTGIATFDDEDKSRVILVNFENGAKLYSNLISILSKYIDIDRNYDFIPHMTINKDLEIGELPDYNWKPNVLYIEFSKDMPATMIEFETGKVSCTQRLVESSQKLSWNIDTGVYNFENELKKQNISFYKENNTYIIDHKGNVYLHSLKQLPNNIQFNNGGNVTLNSLKQLPNNVQFNNGGSVYLNSLEQLPDNIQFNNGGHVDLFSLEQLPDNIQFNNGGHVDLFSLEQLPDNKYEIFKNKGVVRYDNLNKVFNPNMKLFAGYTAIL